MTQDINLPVEEVNIRRITATKKRLNNRCIFSCIMIIAEQIVFSAKFQTPKAVFSLNSYKVFKNVLSEIATLYAKGTGTPFPIILNFFVREIFPGSEYESGTP